MIAASPRGTGGSRRRFRRFSASRAYRDNGAVFITWDEGATGSDGPIGMIVLSPLSKVNYANSIYYTHSSTLRTMQVIFGVRPFLRDAANATDLSDLSLNNDPGRPPTGQQRHLR